MKAFLPIMEVPQSHPPPYVHASRKVRREGSPATPLAHARGPLFQGFILLLIAIAAIAGHARLSTCATEETYPDNDVPVGPRLHRDVTSSLAPSFAVPTGDSDESFGSLILHCGGEWFNDWYGRTGNNILSIFNAALTARLLGLKFGISNCSHPIIDLNSLLVDMEANIYNDTKIIMSPSDAFYQFMDPETGLTLPLEACCTRRTILVPLLRNAASFPISSKYAPDALIIHIRSGDIFDKEGSIHPSYSPPPLTYYQEIVEEHSMQGREIVLVTQNDHMSPLVATLLEIYPHIKVQAGSLEEDVAVVLAARHLVVSQGTFAWALGLASSKLERLYTFNGDLDYRAFCNADVVRYTTTEWMIKEWTASDAQIDYLLDFPRGSMRKNLIKRKRSC